MATTQTLHKPWSRSSHGVLAGVCKGIAERFQLDVTLVRLGYAFAVLFFGVGIGVYILCALSLPSEANLDHAYDSRIFGVASRFARRFDLDVGLTRLVFLFLLFVSGGCMLLAYLILYFVLPTDSELKTS
jgi:phage shock protein PspC (stress-responsive transcriptional regulator)